MFVEKSAGHTHELRVADRQAITDVLVDYCLALDRMDLKSLASLFMLDCQVEYGPEGRLRSTGRLALAKSLERMWRWSRTSHHLSNVRISFTAADRAESISYVHAWHERPNGSTATVYGQYRDRLVYSDGAWLISERRMLMQGSDAEFTVNLYQLDRLKAPSDWVAPVIDAPAGESEE